MIGSDAEVFVAREDGTIISAIGLIGGSKEHPQLTKHGAVQEDNVLAEFNVNPANTSEEFVKNFLGVMEDLEEILRKQGLRSIIKSSAHLDPEELKHPQAILAGCEEDFCAWDWSINEKPQLVGTNLRTAGAHVHLSWDDFDGDVMEQFHVAGTMDLFHGLPGLLFDNDVERRTLYGKAGACRLKSYGVEYRTSSNWWIKHPEWIAWTFEQAQLAIKNRHNYDILDMGQEIQSCINTNNVTGAKKIMNQFGVKLP